jgi:hypothetical protein
MVQWKLRWRFDFNTSTFLQPEFRSGVASGILPDGEGGILPPGKDRRNTLCRQQDHSPDWISMVLSAGQESPANRQAAKPAATSSSIATPI